jgi:hypothetical protein
MNIEEWLYSFSAKLVFLKNPAMALPMPPSNVPLPLLLAAWRAVAGENESRKIDTSGSAGKMRWKLPGCGK